MGSSRSDRIAFVIVLGLIVPALATLIWELYFLASDPDSSGHGEFLMLYGVYATAFVIWTGLRAIAPMGCALVPALVVFVIGLPFTIAVSLGIYALFLPSCALGGVVASVAYPARRRITA